MADQEHVRRVVKKVKKGGGHHGGSWKIAYADFVTAMMAFFLLMWLLSLLNKYQLEGVAQYFKKPLKEVLNKQSSVVESTSKRPDEVGNTRYDHKGAKSDSQNAVDVSKGSQDKPENSELSTPLVSPNPLTPKESQKDPASASQKLADGNGQPIPPQPANKNKDKDQDKTKDHDKDEIAKQQMAQMQAVVSKMQENLNKNPQLSEYKNMLNFKITPNGIKIELRDLKDKPMFSQGKTDFQQYAAPILSWLSSEINQYPNRLVIIGHTDALPYNGGNNYSNWELSADRANATRRELIKYGMDPNKVLRIIGDADKNLLNKQNQADPSNRRIDIMILTKDAAEQFQQE